MNEEQKMEPISKHFEEYIATRKGKITVETVVKGWQDGSGFAYENVISTVEFNDAADYLSHSVPLEDWWEKDEHPNYDDLLIQTNYYDDDTLIFTTERWESELDD